MELTLKPFEHINVLSDDGDIVDIVAKDLRPDDKIVLGHIKTVHHVPELHGYPEYDKIIVEFR